VSIQPLVAVTLCRRPCRVQVGSELHVSSTSCSSSGETNCVNTTSGSCHSVSAAVSYDSEVNSVVGHVGHLSRIITVCTVNKYRRF